MISMRKACQPHLPNDNFDRLRVITVRDKSNAVTGCYRYAQLVTKLDVHVALPRRKRTLSK